MVRLRTSLCSSSMTTCTIRLRLSVNRGVICPFNARSAIITSDEPKSKPGNVKGCTFSETNDKREVWDTHLMLSSTPCQRARSATLLVSATQRMQAAHGQAAAHPAALDKPDRLSLAVLQRCISLPVAALCIGCVRPASLSERCQHSA